MKNHPKILFQVENPAELQKTRPGQFTMMDSEDDENTKVIEIEGYIGWWMASKARLQWILEYSSFDQLILKINSPGGNAHEAIDIYNYLSGLKKSKGVYIISDIVGNYASAATIVSLVGDEIRACNNIMGLLHQPSLWIGGTKEDLIKGAYELELLEGVALEMYGKRCNLSDDDLMDVLVADRWENAYTLQTWGLIDVVYDPNPENKKESNIDMAVMYKELPPLPQMQTKKRKFFNKTTVDMRDKKTFLQKLRDLVNAEDAQKEPQTQPVPKAPATPAPVVQMAATTPAPTPTATAFDEDGNEVTVTLNEKGQIVMETVPKTAEENIFSPEMFAEAIKMANAPIQAQIQELQTALGKKPASDHSQIDMSLGGQPPSSWTVSNPITGRGGYYMGDPREKEFTDQKMGAYGYEPLARMQSTESQLWMKSQGREGSLPELNQIEQAYVMHSQEMRANPRRMAEMCAGMNCDTINMDVLNQELGACVTMVFSNILQRESSMTPLGECFTIIEDVVDETMLIELMTSPVIQNWHCGFHPKGGLYDWAVHKGKTHEGKVDTCWCLQDIARGYFNRLRSPGFTPWNYPLSLFLIELLVKQVMKDLYKALIKGVHDPSVAGTPQANELTWTDGFHTIIDKMVGSGFATVPTGGIFTPGTQYDIVKKMRLGISEEYRNEEMILYAPAHFCDLLAEDLMNRGMGACCVQEFADKSIMKDFRFPEGTIKCCSPAHWTNTQRLMLTPKWNAQVLVDLMSDFLKVRVQQFGRKEMVMMDFKAAANIAVWHEDYVSINNMA